MHGFEALGTALGAILGALALLGASVAGGRTLLRLYRGLTNLVDDWRGEPARPGVPKRPGMMERVGALEELVHEIRSQLRPNGGATLRDAVSRIEQKVTPPTS